ncbi:MAG: hypothetical protein H0Z24_06725 [Thermosipho sp. (in: Bacteria)]|nr:hypothetical protein [Thermosipho sp. (in: thermotogales)]
MQKQNKKIKFEVAFLLKLYENYLIKHFRDYLKDLQKNAREGRIDDLLWQLDTVISNINESLESDNIPAHTIRFAKKII